MKYLRLIASLYCVAAFVLAFAAPVAALPQTQFAEVQVFLDSQPGVLKTYLDDDRPAAYHIESASAYYGISPRLHVVLLEAVNRLISDPQPAQSALRQPYGAAGPDGFALQIEWASTELRAGLGPYTREPVLHFTDQTTVTLSLQQQPEIISVQRFLAIGRSQSEWRSLLDRFNQAFALYFNNELPESLRAEPVATNGFLELPWQPGVHMVHLAYFDHVYPTVDSGDDGNNYVVNYLGRGGVQYDGHDGHDYYFPDQPIGTPIMAAAPGMAFARTARGNGVVIRHTGGYETVYWHLDRFAPIFNGLIDSSNGVYVEAGAYLGTSGRTGFVKGTPHLHFEVRHNGRQVDPYGWYGGGSDPCAAYIACEASVWLWHSKLIGSYDFTPPDLSAMVDTNPPLARMTVAPREDLRLLARFDDDTLPDLGHSLPFVSDNLGYTEGRWGKAVRINGPQEVSFLTEEQLSLQSGTLNLWLKLPEQDPLSTIGRYYSLAASALPDDPSKVYSGTLALRREKSDHGMFWNFWTVDNQGQAHSLVAPDTASRDWQALSLSWDAATQSKKLYINGQLVAQAQAPGLPNDVGPLLHLGRFTTGSAPSGVSIDELALFDRVLSDEEIAALAESNEPLQAGSLAVDSLDPQPSVSLDLNAFDRESSVDTITVGVNGEWSDPLPYQGRLTWPLPAVEGPHEVAVRFWDRAEHSTIVSQTVLLNLAPRAQIALRDNDQINATVQISVDDASAQIEMQLSADPQFTATQWQAFRPELEWAWGPVREHVLYARFRDAEGLVSPTIRVSDRVWTLYLPHVAP
jgi:murein DD-endopeptidase MepM/ murein hydrolase activator NlpD